MEGYFLSHKGELVCTPGTNITNVAECATACSRLDIPIKAIKNGYVCYKDVHHDCYQDGQNGDNDSLVCERGNFGILH